MRNRWNADLRSSTLKIFDPESDSKISEIRGKGKESFGSREFNAR